MWLACDVRARDPHPVVALDDDEPEGAIWRIASVRRAHNLAPNRTGPCTNRCEDTPILSLVNRKSFEFSRKLANSGEMP